MKQAITALIATSFLALGACGNDGAAQNKSSASQAKSFDIAAKNLSGVVRWQEIKPGSAEYHFLIGGYEALAGVEHILQVRYANYSGELPLVPGGQSPLGYNPDAKFDPAFLENALSGALTHWQRAQDSLDKAVGKDFAINVNIGELWFDINKNGKRDAGEDLVRQLSEIPQFRNTESSNKTVRFDTADADWLAAYVHVLSGSAEMILSTDPTPAIKTITEGRALLQEKGAIKSTPFVNDGGDPTLETFAVFITALRGTPDKVRTNAALSHFKAMIAHNKSFWRLVMAETDDENEWLPNPKQTAAFGPNVSLEMAEGWQDVLGDISDILEGKTLLPYWRVTSREGSDRDIGINVEKLMQDPSDFDIILMIQGTAIAPYLEEGEIAEMRSWRRFSRMTSGNSSIMALWFN